MVALMESQMSKSTKLEILLKTDGIYVADESENQLASLTPYVSRRLANMT